MATYAITGANRGIGLELVRALRKRGDDVIALCRKPSAHLEETGARIEAGIDVGRDDVVDELRKRFTEGTIDVLINNAGVLAHESLEGLDFDSIRRQFEVNALGPLRVTRGLLDRLGSGGKLVMITSRMGSIADNGSGGAYGYRMSKTALNMAATSLAKDLAGRGIAVGIVHPGWVRTEMTGNNGLIDPRESAAGILERIDQLSIETSGTFWHQNGERLPW